MSLVGVRDIIGTTKEKPQFSAAFANLKEKLALERKEKAEYAKKLASSPCRWIG